MYKGYRRCITVVLAMNIDMENETVIHLATVI